MSEKIIQEFKYLPVPMSKSSPTAVHWNVIRWVVGSTWTRRSVTRDGGRMSKASGSCQVVAVVELDAIDGCRTLWLIPALMTPPGTSRLKAPVNSRRSKGTRMTLPQHSTASISIDNEQT